ncbi:DUF4153 domain-containing protein [Flavobacterium psychrotolerans]|uniref:DUF4173 domain-containing protein n=1 Tax=Flavobacterium psychrotolerans TaxID=2169410 RepID=A0A2U1JQY1_9FLAO|nr:DUF4173 domain-containing protein [Flavobacterium psychrotolerans]PWA07238.1 DUF4173 domain-containing protein [Flavobacterium psychrotolerans]
MKKHHLILASSTIFTLLFYNESVGLNLAVFGLSLSGLICYFFRSRFIDNSNWVLMISTILSCSAFAWYGDFASFLALVFSLIFLQFKTQDPKLKIIQSIPVVFINQFSSIVRIFQFSQWLPKRRTDNVLVKKLIAFFLIPTLFIIAFYTIYSFGSEHFSGLFTNYTLDLDLFEVVLIGSLGFYISFTFWNYWVPQFFYDINSKLDNDFNEASRKVQKQTFEFLELDFERKSGEITMLLLNCLLLVFIATYNYEQFFQENETVTLSSAIHERVNAVIFSIVMAVGVMLFYFKNGFNFDAKAKKLKLLSQIWIILNGLLILSTIIKNSEYVSIFGLTYKRLGVYAFLILAIIGLFFTFLKIYKQKTNAYLINHMVWYFYGTILLCSFVNWGNMVTVYNISVNKGVDSEFLISLNFNEVSCMEYFSLKPDETEKLNYIKQNVKNKKNISFLSKALYYESLKVE